MNEAVTTTIDPDKCSGCGQCLAVCPDRTITMVAGRAAVTGDRCFQCGHCLAVCPTGAVKVAALAPDSLRFKTFTVPQRWLPWGEFDPGLLVQLMASRRSCRNYLDKPVEHELLLDLVKAGTTAPSGTNSQKWTFTILERRNQVAELGGRVAGFFEKLNRLAVNPAARLLSRLFGGDALGNYHRRYYRSINEGLREWREEGRDLLFHGATAAIVVGSESGASCPAEDALLATQNILLTAHALGLGSCLIGFAVAALEREPTLKDGLQIPPGEKVHAVIALGWPAESYQRLSGRKEPVIRYVKT
ncbi:MAG TPA: nitroreductase family protein [Desulfurivibrionaceae bacterium]|nr:nitroreductase family protein [Desulfurivibrionaceae bacterium]